MSGSKSNLTKPLKCLLRLLWLIGANRPKKNLLSYFAMISMTIMSLHLLLELFLTWNGMETLKRVKYLPSVLMSTIKGTFLIFNSNRLSALIKMLKSFWRAESFHKEIHINVNRIHRWLLYIVLGYSVACVSFCVLFMVAPFLVEDEIILVLFDYTLCDINVSICWWMNYIWQSYAVLFQILPSGIACDCIFLILIGYVYNGCYMFTEALTRLNTEDVSYRKYFFKQAVNQHDLLITFVSDMDDIFTVIMVLQFWCSLWSMILFLNMMVANGLPPKVDEVLFYGTIYLIFVFQIFLYSYCGAIIEDQIKNLANNIFLHVNWYDKGRTSLRKDLSLMIFRAQNSKILSAGKMSELNLVLWVATMKNSLSVFTLIWKLAEEHANNNIL